MFGYRFCLTFVNVFILILSLVLLFLVLVGVVQGQDYWNNLRCRSCERAESFDRCNQYKICLDNEACYMDKIIDGTRILFNGGCRSKAVCIASGKKRRHESSLEKREDLIACSRCCDGTDYCNDHLCGIKPVTNNTLCNSCDGRDGRPHPPQYPEDCAYLRACEPDQACFSSMIMHDEKTLRHYTTCESLKTCQHLNEFILQSYKQADPVVGKRDVGTICAVCCGDNFCNKYACETTKTTYNTICYSCDGRDGRPSPTPYPEDCVYQRECEPDQACFSSTIVHSETTLRHYTTCESLTTCHRLNEFILQSPVVGKRDETICAVCCGDDLCNNYACETTKKRLKYLNAQHRYNHTTLKEIQVFD